ncbi:phage head-tail joining protein [Histidinibacterium lentulum]|uniref:Uncharacterized protein n=1 Tax=Histidinibacterium lentulum TaxID=2480588 RepID=A0A3N2QVB4_9RHOB|nr:hypothetical protein [Histidinibacterium lentulum]ROT99079.1 hypothetical protein EAT49_15805 [Histidinibacterium lentulum]
MALDLSELETLRDALLRARAKGVRTVGIGDKRVEYSTDAEMAAAIADLEARIRRASATRPSRINFTTSKGF